MTSTDAVALFTFMEEPAMALGLGIGIEGVIIGQKPDEEFHLLSPDCFQVLRLLKESVFGERIFLVCQANFHKRQRILMWFDREKFYNFTGISFANIYFCDEANEQAQIARAQAITHFIDNRLEVLSHFVPLVKDELSTMLFLFQGRREEINRFAAYEPLVVKLSSWQSLAKNFLA